MNGRRKASADPENRAKLRDWMDRQKVLKKRALIEEREVFHAISSSQEPEMASILELYNVFLQQRQREAKELMTNLENVAITVDEVKSRMDKVVSGQRDISTLKRVLEKAETMLEDFKHNERQRYDGLEKTAVSLGKELDIIAKRFESSAWGTVITAPTPRKKGLTLSSSRGSMSKSHTLASTNLPPEVTEFGNFLEHSGGVTGGWDEEEHVQFARIMESAPKEGLERERYLVRASKALAIYDLNAVMIHDEWYREYCRLDAAKRLAVAKWKEKKKEEREELLKGANEKEEVDEKEQARRARKTADEQKFRKEQQHRLSEWKKQRKTEQRKEEEQRRKTEEKSLKKKKEAFEKRRIQATAQLAAWDAEQKARKDAADMENKELQQSQMRRRPSEDVLSRIREREEAVVKRHMELKEQKKREMVSRMERQEKLADQSRVVPEAQRDPSRLLKKTSAAENREKDRSKGGGQYIGSIPHRAIPEWRKGL